MVDAIPAFDPVTQTFADSPETIGLLAREAIYYGAENFYQHQLARFTRHRYREDATWLLQNVGFSVRPMIEIATHIVDQIKPPDVCNRAP